MSQTVLLCTARSLRWSRNKWKHLQGESYSSDWKYDYGLDVLMKKFSALSGMFPFAGQVLQGWVALVTPRSPSRIFLSRKGEKWNTRAEQTFLLQTSQMLLSLHTVLFKKRAAIWWSLYSLISPLSSFYLGKRKSVIWSPMKNKCGVICWNSTAFPDDLKHREMYKANGGGSGDGDTFWWI